jgi:hypothetical protein
MLLFALIYAFALVVVVYFGGIFLGFKAEKMSGFPRTVLVTRSNMLMTIAPLMVLMLWFVAGAYNDKPLIYLFGALSFFLVYLADILMDKGRGALAVISLGLGWGAIIIMFILALIR